MVSSLPPRPPAPPLKVLHLVGARSDQGGILSVLRALQSALPDPAGDSLPRILPAVWVHDSFVERRPPPLDLRRNPAALDEDASHLRLLLAAIRSWPGLRRLLATEPFDVVHGHSRGAFPLGVWLARQSRRRQPSPAVLFTNHTYANRTGMYRQAVLKGGLPMVVLTPNMARHYGLVGTPGVEIISACVNDAFFQRPLSSPPRDPAGRIRFVGVGNLVRWKNWHLLLEAWARLPKELQSAGRFELWGPTLEDAEGRRYAAELHTLRDQLQLGEVVAFRGPTNAVAEVVTGADWFVIPSTNEPCSVALMEALALGRPALVSASGGNIDIVQAGVNGRHFQPGDVDDLARQLAIILGGAGVTATVSGLRESVRQRSAQSVAIQYQRLYQRLGSGQRSGRVTESVP